MIELAPSILSANFARLADDAKAALEGGGTLLHVDVMDGHFVRLRASSSHAATDCVARVQARLGHQPRHAGAYG